MNFFEISVTASTASLVSAAVIYEDGSEFVVCAGSSSKSSNKESLELSVLPVDEYVCVLIKIAVKLCLSLMIL